MLKIDRSMIRYLSQRADDFELPDIIKRASWEQRRFVCRPIHVMIARKGFEGQAYRSRGEAEVQRRGGRKRELSTRKPMDKMAA